ncbi:MAG TPA: NAD(P)-binding domain-containing protein [Xanthobacteraceae bacterium]|nr:NAD(P)-binding domain-containing protein [Xanthobacteraceae bacterium]
MEILIVGSGNVGQALGRAWKRAGRAITFAVRDITSPKVADLKSQNFRVAGLRDAAKAADAVVLAVPYGGIEGALSLVGDLSGKILIDATNPLTPDLDLAVGFDSSAGEMVAKLAKGARVVKAFNTTGAENMDKASAFPEKPAMFIASDDSGAKAIVQKLAEEIGFEAIDAGPLKASRYLEPMAMQWIKLAFSGMGTQFAFSIVRRG